MRSWLYVAILFALVILGLNIFLTRLLFGLNNILLGVALVAVVAAFIFDRRSRQRKNGR